MTAQRCICPAAVYFRDRHMVVDRRWILTDPAGIETVLCSLSCMLTVACRLLPADIEARRNAPVEAA